MKIYNEDDGDICPCCNGSGEGSNEFISCRECGGSGETIPYDDDDGQDAYEAREENRSIDREEF